MRPTSSDPRIPPILEIKNPKGSDTQTGIEKANKSNVVEIPIADVLKPVKPYRSQARGFSDIPRELDDWFEKIDGYSIIENDYFERGGWDDIENEQGTAPYPDCWAWYCPFHFYEEDAGIYIRGDKLPELSRRILSFLTYQERRDFSNADKASKLQFGAQIKQAAFLHLFLHEMYHHKVEAFATRLEIASNSPKFIPYYDSVYYPLAHPLDDELIEEGLANAHVIRSITNDRRNWSRQFPKINHCPSVREVWERFEFFTNLNCSVEGYRTVKQYIDTTTKKISFREDNFSTYQRKLQQTVNQASKKPLGNSQIWEFAPNMMTPFWNRNIIAYEVVYPTSGPSLVPQGALQAVQASPRKVIRASRKWGLRKHREAKGDHTIYIGPTGQKVSIDGGYNDLPHACWEGLLSVVNAEYGLNLKDNQEGRRKFFAGPS
jgi:hypothetical protein